MNKNLLKVENLTMKFGGLTAIDDLSFSANNNEITSIIGPNGAGKTTVFNCLTGFYKPTAGEMLLNKNNEILSLKSNYFRLFLYFYIYLVFISVLSDNFYESIKSSLTYIRFGFFSLAVVFILKNKKDFIKHFYLMICFTFIILIFDGYFQFITGKNILGFRNHLRPDRLSSLFLDELILGSYLGKFLPIFCTFYLLNKGYFNKYYILTLVILTYILIFLSGERAAFFTTTLYLIMVTPFLIGIKRALILFVLIGTMFGALISTNKNIKSRYVDQMLLHTFGLLFQLL